MPPEHHGPSSVAPPAEAPLLPGRLRERYRTQQLLRATGAAQIWLAVDEKLNRMVAVYLMVSADASASGLLTSARAAATVPDTRFLQILDAIDDGSNTYVVTEWLPDAVPLTSVLTTGPLPAGDAVRLVTDVAEALASAHALGQTHIRLDPVTVLRTPAEQVKVQGLRIEAALAGLDGTARPESEAADIRALGALLYAALTATWPFGSGYGLSPAPLDGGVPRSPSALAPGISAEVSALTLRLLAPQETTGPAVPSCHEAVEELTRLRRPAPARPTAAPGPGQPRRAEGGPDIAHRAAPVIRPGASGRYTDRTPVTREAGRESPWRRMLLPGLLVLLLVGGVALVGTRLLGASGSGSGQEARASTSSAQAETTPVELKIADAHLWQASPEDEHSEDVADTITGTGDGWHTFSYADGPKMIIKPGTGIIYDLGSVQTVSSATVEIGTAGAVLEMRAAPTSLETLPAVVAGKAPPGFLTLTSVATDSTTVQLRAEQPVRTRYVLVWFTSLPRQPLDETHHYPYYDSIRQVRFFG